MTQLSELFEKHRHELKQSIDENPTPNGVVRETQTFLNILFAEYRADEAQDLDRAGLVELMKDLMKDFLKLTLSIPRAAIEATETHARHPEHPTLSQQEEPGSSRTATTLGLGGLRGRLEKALSRSAQSPGREESNAPKSAPAYPGTHADRAASARDKPGAIGQVEVQFEVDAFLAKLADVFADGDNLLAAVNTMAEKTPEPKPRLEDDPELLSLLQDLLEAKETKDSNHALSAARNVSYVLRRHHVKAEYYKDGNEHLFDSVPNLDPDAQQPATLRPALVRDDSLLKRGLVAEPTSNRWSDER